MAEDKEEEPTSTGEEKPRKKTATELLEEQKKKDPKSVAKVEKVAKQAEDKMKKTEKTKKVTPKAKAPEVKLEVTIDDLTKIFKELPVKMHTDKSGFTAIRSNKSGKILTYIQQTKRGISFYVKGKPNWKIADKKITTQKELDAFVKTIETQLENA